ncbi:MAG: ferredoxin [candidate division WOR-3 bacterium]|nr:ferredoxin [candidate division WOR-3 bacterium]MDH5683349.1 ferredoxin [candidate division WOR-3 bacterium]
MKVSIDNDLCSGCELCVSTCPEVFEMQGDIATVKADAVPEEHEESVQQAADDCPTSAIIIESREEG